VLSTPLLATTLTDLLLIETTTLSVRRYPIIRTALARETVRVATRYGEITVKIAHHRGQRLRGKPEYEDCKRLALEYRAPIHAVYAAVREALATQEVPPQTVEPPP
jgi:uncharacterized protein (DUF111 family)